MEGQSLTIRKPDDFHVHLRDGNVLKTVAPLSAAQFGRILVMPNLKPPVVTVEDAKQYRDRILKAVPGVDLIMTLYLTDNTTPEMIRDAANSGIVKACKLYPAGVTTNSASGVTSLDKISKALDAMEQLGIILCVHGEVTPDVREDMFDREREFVRSVLVRITSTYPKLKVVVEHVSTKEAVEYVLSHPSDNISATVTPQHLCFDRSALFKNSKLHMDLFCLPILKTRDDREAIRSAVKSGSRRFFAGTDSAPHPQCDKIGGAAGVFSAAAAVELYAEAFDEMDAMEQLEPFLSENGARFYGLELNHGSLSLKKTPKEVPRRIAIENSEEYLTPMKAGELLSWSVVGTG
ncbi:hypothetical protein NDN08_006221 [Rhodosorus marinus]|uniref:dihydroorotase n=1 Tax=Rhodosorus marinus TaxID=101924 RepID=A0AAV8UP15_9RHOD|nr:hypothetical protein NDN08_006221 [Rhodosorus marinus]